MALILAFAYVTAVVISETKPALFGIVKLICFTLFAFAMFIPPWFYL